MPSTKVLFFCLTQHSNVQYSYIIPTLDNKLQIISEDIYKISDMLTK